MSRGKSASKVRILSGRWKGRPLEVPRGARPTSSRAREALFDILQDDVAGARFLDLFAGSGSVGLEALSRGASAAVFVEKDARALESNAAALGAGAGELEVVRSDARPALAELASRGEKFDLVFVDPPYELEGALSSSIAALLAPGGRLVLQMDSGATPPDLPGLSSAGRRAYGRNVFHFFERAEA